MCLIFCINCSLKLAISRIIVVYKTSLYIYYQEPTVKTIFVFLAFNASEKWRGKGEGKYEYLGDIYYLYHRPNKNEGKRKIRIDLTLETELQWRRQALSTERLCF